MNLVEYYRGKKVLVTGHNGFKGTWLTQWLIEMGSDVYGVSLKNEHEYSLFEILDCKSQITHKEFDIRDYDKLLDFVKSSSPEIVFHLAAQPIVLESYNDPMYTHQVNYLGTLNVLESIRNVDSVKTVIIVTSDKVYKPNESGKALNELDQLGGIDPYSASKSAVELLVASYRESYLKHQDIRIFTARAGNVLGFGDWGKNRLIPDLFRSLLSGTPLKVRNPDSIRPWQHVNDVIYGYLILGSHSSSNLMNLNSFNFGPSNSHIKVSEIIQLAQSELDGVLIDYETSYYNETKSLVLDSTNSRKYLGWIPKYDVQTAVHETIEQFDLMIKGKSEINSSIIQSIKNYL